MKTLMKFPLEIAIIRSFLNVKYWYFLLLLIIILLVLFILDVRNFYFNWDVNESKTGYEYEICDEEGCRMITIDKTILPSEKTFYVRNEKVDFTVFISEHPKNKCLSHTLFF